MSERTKYQAHHWDLLAPLNLCQWPHSWPSLQTGVCSPDIVLCWQRLAHRDGERQCVAGLPSHPLGQRPHLPTMSELSAIACRTIGRGTSRRRIIHDSSLCHHRQSAA